MKLLEKLSIAGLVLTFLVVMPAKPQARVMMTGSISGFILDITPTNMTVDEWFSNPNLWTLTITNSGDDKTVKKAVIHIEITSGYYGIVLSGDLTVVDESKSFLTEMLPGTTFTVNNTMIEEGAEQMSGGEWSEEFRDEVLRIGYLPEGTYILRFTLTGYYGDENDPIEEQIIEKMIEIKNPSPPELITPDDTSDDVVTIPRFAWQRPLVSDFSSINNRVIEIFYNITVWKMFEDDGTVLSEEDAITRIPIWRVEGLRMESVDFDPGTAREELISGRKYCWQVQARDGTGRPISTKNEGKSDVWDFTVQFSPPVINEPLSFFPLGFNWTAAEAGGGLVLYRVRIADNPDFSGAYMAQGLVMTSFTYPQDAPPLRLGVLYYLEVQATDDSGIPIGEPAQTTFTLPTSEVLLREPENESVISTPIPTFSWQGTSPYYVVMVYDEASDWTYLSGSIEGTSWTYDGDELQPGTTYAWNVSPANNLGDVVGDSSETWRFTLAAANQVFLMSPINKELDTIYPTFTWRRYTPLSGEGEVRYTIIIEDTEGTTIHSATVTAIMYQYPQSAPQLNYATQYFWSVNAERNGVEIGRRSQKAGFTTPIAKAGEALATMEEINRIVKLVLNRYPQFAAFQDKIVISITDQSGPITPAEFLALFGTYNLTNIGYK